MIKKIFLYILLIMLSMTLLTKVSYGYPDYTEETSTQKVADNIFEDKREIGIMDILTNEDVKTLIGLGLDQFSPQAAIFILLGGFLLIEFPTLRYLFLIDYGLVLFLLILIYFLKNILLKKDANISSCIKYGLIPIFGVFYIISELGIVFSEIEAKSKIVKDPNIINQKLNYWEQNNNVTPAQIIGLSNKNIYLVLFMFLAEMNSTRIIYFSDDYKGIYFPNNTNSYRGTCYENILNILNGCMIHVKETRGIVLVDTNNYYFLPIEYLDEYLQKFYTYKILYQELSKAVMPKRITKKEYEKLIEDREFFNVAKDCVYSQEISYKSLVVNYTQTDLISRLFRFSALTSQKANMLKTNSDAGTIFNLALCSFDLFDTFLNILDNKKLKFKLDKIPYIDKGNNKITKQRKIRLRKSKEERMA